MISYGFCQKGTEGREAGDRKPEDKDEEKIFGYYAIYRSCTATAKV